MIAINNLNIKN